jgi:hypothetical protein
MRARHLHRFADGSAALVRRGWTWLIPAGEWRTAAARVAGTLVGVGFTFTLIERAPGLLWPAAAAWIVAAWRTGRDLERQRIGDGELLALLDDAIGRRNGVLLADVLAALHARQRLAVWGVSELRAAVERLGVRVADSIKVGGRVSVGVYRADLEAVLSPPPLGFGAPSDRGSSAGQAATTSPTTFEARPIGGGVAFSMHESPVAAAPTDDGFEEHLDDALALFDPDVRGEVTDR